MFVGDVMGHDAQIAGTPGGRGPTDYRHNYQYVKPILDHADLAVASKVTWPGSLIRLPRFSVRRRGRRAQGRGFDLLLTANNPAPATAARTV